MVFKKVYLSLAIITIFPIYAMNYNDEIHVNEENYLLNELDLLKNYDVQSEACNNTTDRNPQTEANNLLRSFPELADVLAAEKDTEENANEPNKELEKYSCGNPGCDRTFKYMSARTKHKKYCDKKDTQERNILTNKKYKCDECNYSTYNHGNLHKHKKNHPKASYPCPNKGCNKEFKLQAQLTNHKKCCDARTEEQRKVAQPKRNRYKTTSKHDKPYKCDFPDCSNAYSHKNALYPHKKIHQGELNFECDQCRFKCNNEEALKTHNSRNHGRKRKRDSEKSFDHAERNQNLEQETLLSESNSNLNNTEILEESNTNKINSPEIINDVQENKDTQMDIDDSPITRTFLDSILSDLTNEFAYNPNKIFTTNNNPSFQKDDTQTEETVIENKQISDEIYVSQTDNHAFNMTDTMVKSSILQNDLLPPTENSPSQNQGITGSVNIPEKHQVSNLQESKAKKLINEPHKFELSHNINFKIVTLKGLVLVLNNILKKEIYDKTNIAIKQSLIRIKNAIENHEVLQIIANSTDKQIMLLKLTLLGCIEKLRKVYTTTDEHYMRATEIKDLINSKIIPIVINDD